MKAKNVFVALGVVVVAIVVAVSFSRCGGQKAHPSHPVVLVGIDGLEWSVLSPLVRDGKLPNLRRLIDAGVAGQLITFGNNNALSPVIWTTIATGTSPSVHGVKNFLSPSGVPYTSNSRRGKALWNIAGDYGLRTVCVGWWVTYPAEEISGCLVAPYSAAGQNQVNWKGNLRKDLPDQTWPRDLIKEVYPIAERINEKENFAKVDRPYFGGIDVDQLSALERDTVLQTRWSEAADETFAEIAVHLLATQEKRPDLTMAYLGGPDVSSHRFWKYRSPEQFHFEIPEPSKSLLHETIDRFYIRTDEMLGSILAAAPQDANVIVCSDHGFHAVNTETPDPLGISGHHLDGPPGTVIAAGPDIRTGPGRELLAREMTAAPARLGSVFEVAPTVLYLLDIPGGRNMESPKGGLLLRNVARVETLDQRPIADPVESHDIDFRIPSDPLAVSERDTQDIKDWMNQIGYTGAGSSTWQLNVPKDRDEQARRDLQELKTRIDAYRRSKNVNPERLDQLAPPLIAPDPWGHAYLYRKTEHGGAVWSMGANGNDEQGAGDDLLISLGE